tara:strand:- start:1663 stop:1794 length:132 start_codon:yes stop_codon:yes gene_type:complete
LVHGYFKKVRQIADRYVRAFEGDEKKEEDNAEFDQNTSPLDGL